MMSESMIEAVQQVAQAPFVPKQRFRCFTIPKRLLYDDNLANLSHSALKLYVFLSYKEHKKPSESQVSLADWAIVKHLDIPAEDVPRARQELKDAKLIDYRRRGHFATSYLLAQDVSLHESVTSFADLPK
jgi:hypothetical protein